MNARRLNRPLIMGSAISAIISIFAGSATAAPPSFRHDVKPILQGNCVECHHPGGQGYKQSGLDMTTYEGLMKGTRYGRVVIPGDAFSSNLVVLIEGRADPSISMPFHKSPLGDDQIEIIKRWIDSGAPNN